MLNFSLSLSNVIPFLFVQARLRELASLDVLAAALLPEENKDEKEGDLDEAPSSTNTATAEEGTVLFSILWCLHAISVITVYIFFLRLLMSQPFYITPVHMTEFFERPPNSISSLCVSLILVKLRVNCEFLRCLQQEVGAA
jgi:hypothetical protein